MTTKYRATVIVDFEAKDHFEFRSLERSLLALLAQRPRADFPVVDFRITERRPRKRARCPAPDETWPG